MCIENVKKSVDIEGILKIIQEKISSVNYVKIYGNFTIGKNVQKFISNKLLLEMPDGQLYQRGDWDMTIGRELEDLILKSISNWIEEQYKKFPIISEKTEFRLTFFINKESIEILDWIEEDYESDSHERGMSWNKEYLPRSPVSTSLFRKR